MKLRLVAAAIAGLALAIGLTGCNMLTPQATTNQYNPGDGLNGETGEVAFRNALLVVDADDPSRGSLNVTFINESDSPQQMSVQVGDQQVQIPLQPGVSVFGYQDNQIVLPVDNPVAGSTMTAAFAVDGGESVTIDIQVFSTEAIGYEDLGPTPDPVDPSEDEQAEDEQTEDEQ
ncbi:MAG TPA: hypothetical protein H9830_14240 [Candidatus Agrococcus pullicola]|uniref:DNA modification methylase n=1 Tax=Candidatus Agrococcus pullicola TaxID=2838429 RepID=A0A9D1YY53_9MICO|nr:hypothetical protein [Candidatus Agrococcus pullicola]